MQANQKYFGIKCFTGFTTVILPMAAGFTLIELSIVLVIIGLVIGGVLVGKDLIEASRVRAALSQLEQYTLAVNTFKAKYNGLPGDIKDAQKFGFIARGTNRGEGDGDGVLESSIDPFNIGTYQTYGENATFWVDLSSAGLINESFDFANSTTAPSGNITGNDIGLYVPQSKVSGNYLMVFSGGISLGWIGGGWSPSTFDGKNYFALQGVQQFENGNVTPIFRMPVHIAYMMDSKLDDGKPTRGKIQASAVEYHAALYVHGTLSGSGSVETMGDDLGITGDTTTCYDNDGIANDQQQYSTDIDRGAMPNCALIFKASF
jgi:prepilin-type N-terminal cleavage/methylation domain-containing protein